MTHADLASLLRSAIDDLREGRERTLPQVALLNLLALHRERRNGFSGERLVDELQRLLGPTFVPADPVPDSLVELLGHAHRELSDSVRGRAFLSNLLSRAEEESLTPLLLDLMAKMWEDGSDDARRVVLALRAAHDGPDVRQALKRWATRNDVAGDAARELLSERESPARDFTSLGEMVTHASEAVERGETNAAAIRALNEVLTAAAHDLAGNSREATRTRDLIEEEFGPGAAALRPSAREVEEVLLAVEAAAPYTRQSSLALIRLVTGIASSAAVPALLRTLHRLGATVQPSSEPFIALPVVRDLLKFRDLVEVSSALEQWPDAVNAMERLPTTPK